MIFAVNVRNSRQFVAQGVLAESLLFQLALSNALIQEKGFEKREKTEQSITKLGKIVFEGLTLKRRWFFKCKFRPGRMGDLYFYHLTLCHTNFLGN
jgi:hypothetical protein